MKHRLAPSIEILGTLNPDRINEQSILGHEVEETPRFGELSHPASTGIRALRSAPILLVNRLPRRRRTADCIIGVGYISAWATSLGAAQGIFLEDLDDAQNLGRLAAKGFHSTYTYLFRAASITKWNAATESDERSIVVDAEALECVQARLYIGKLHSTPPH